MLDNAVIVGRIRLIMRCSQYADTASCTPKVYIYMREISLERLSI